MNKPSKTTSGNRRRPQRSEAHEFQEREEMIARAAYLRAERRGFRGGDPVADWLEAEAEVEALLSKPHKRIAEEPQARSSSDEYLDKLKAQLKTGTERLEQLRPKLTRLKTEARKEWERELVKLDALRDTLAQQAQSWRRRSETKRAEIKLQVEKVLKELEAGLEKLTSRIDKK